MDISTHQIKIRLAELDVPQGTFCYLAGISETRFSRALRGLQSFNGGEIQEFMRILKELFGLCDDLHPIPISFKDPRRIQKLLEHRRSGLRLIPIPVGSIGAVTDYEEDEFIPIAAAR